MNDAPTPENMNRGHVDTSYTEAYFCHPHVKILTGHVNIIRNQKATCWYVGIFSHYIVIIWGHYLNMTTCCGIIMIIS